MDVPRQMVLKVHKGRATSTVGSYDPSQPVGPHGGLWGLSASRSWSSPGMTWTPELNYLHFEQGQDVGASRRNNLRLGLTLAMPL